MTVGSRWLGRGDYVAPAGRRFAMRLLATLVGWRTGGTFTDTIAIDASGAVVMSKVPTTPGNQATGFLRGLRKVPFL